MVDIPRLFSKQIPNTSHIPLPDYTGKYYNSNCLWFLEVFLVEGGLRFCMKEDRQYVYKLSHHDTFSWIMTRDEIVRPGRFPNNFADMYLCKFAAGDDVVNGLYWHNDRGIEESEFYQKPEYQCER